MCGRGVKADRLDRSLWAKQNRAIDCTSADEREEIDGDYRSLRHLRAGIQGP